MQSKSKQIKSLLDMVNTNTVMTKGEMWRQNVRENSSRFGFQHTIKELHWLHEGSKAIVVGAGPSMRERGIKDLQTIVERQLTLGGDKLITIACDGAMPRFIEAEVVPDYIATVDGDPIVAKFYNREESKTWQPKGLLLSITTHPSVVQLVKDRGWPIYWWQPLLPPALADLHQEYMPELNPGGNVGTASYIMAVALFCCKYVGLLGMEFSWSDETPLTETQYFTHLHKATGGDMQRIKDHYVTIYNPIMKKSYIADPVYYFYLLAFMDILKHLPKEAMKNSFTLTPEGIFWKSGVKFKKLEDFLKL